MNGLCKTVLVVIAVDDSGSVSLVIQTTEMDVFSKADGGVDGVC